MTKRTKLIAWLVGVLALGAAGWWALVPRVRTATEAQVRAHVAPELLLPLPHPEGGLQRYEAARQAVQALYGNWRPHVAAAPGPPLDLRDPRVRRVMDILESGPLDRSAEAFDPAAPFYRFVQGLTAAALAAAGQGDWERVRQQMEAAYLLLDRLAASDIVLEQAYYTIVVETTVLKAVLELAARRDLPAALAARCAVLLAVERHSPEQVRQFLRGEFQLRMLRQIPGFLVDGPGRERPWVPAGNYDPIETAVLMSDKFIETGRNAGLPPSRWSSAAADRIGQLWSEVESKPGGVVSMVAQALSYRIRMNTSHNSLGRMLANFGTSRLATFGNTRLLMTRILEARTRREQVAAAVAVARFRRQQGRDPRDFGELVGVGLLPAAPLDHVKEQPLTFDLKALFEWPVPPPQRPG